MGIWTRKSLKDLAARSRELNNGLKRSLSTFDLILLGIGAIIGAGLFSITGIAAAENAGPAIVISFLIAAVGCVLAGLCYSELAAMLPISGSAYTYAYASMGELPAWIIGWSLVLEYAIGAATVAISWSAYIISLAQDLGIVFPANFIASPWQGPVPGMVNIPAFLIVAILSLLLITGIRKAATFNMMIVGIKIAVVVLFIILGIFYIDPQNYTPFIPENTGTFGEYGWSGILRATGVVFFAYIGFDALSTAAQETKYPQKSLPLAILGSLFICTVLYILFSWVLTGIVNYKDLNVPAPVALAIAKTPFPWLHGLMKLAILAGLTSVILVFLMAQSRIFYVMALDGLLPESLAALHTRFHTPWLANLLLILLSGGIAAFMPIDIVGHMTSIGTLLAFTLVCAGVMILRYRHPEFPRPFKVPGFPFIPVMGMLTCLGMMVFLGAASWLRLLVWLALGLLIYWVRRRRAVERKKEN